MPKVCQDTIDLVQTCPDAKQIIQKNSDIGLKARFQHIREARVLGFDVDPYTDIGPTELPFSLEDLQYLRDHFEVFSAVSLFRAPVARLDAYLDIKDARIMYQEQARISAQVPDLIPVPKEPKTYEQGQRALMDVPEHARVSVETDDADTLHTSPKEENPADEDVEEEKPAEEDHNSMGHSILDNMEISMVHILPADFQSSTSQPSFLDGDIVTE